MPDPSLLNNRYRLDEVIGSGGMAVVYRARDQMLERTVAVKLMREDISHDESFRNNFRQEALSAANLYHPNIVTIHDFGLDNNRFFIVMENVPGTDLKSMIVKRGRFSVDDALALMVQACDGIGYAHRAGLVHCDIKPHNILVSNDKRLKVADFGIARALSTIRPDERSNVVWGSPQYFSPEQAAGAAPSFASDVYSLGVVLYEMLTGRLPFIANTAAELARMHREVTPAPPRSLNPSIPSNLEQVILKVLSKEPTLRYRTAGQMGRVLLTIGRPVVSPTLSEETPPPALAPARTHTRIVVPQMPAPREETQPRPTILYPPVHEEPSPVEVPTDDNPLAIDWGTLFIALLALIAVSGLVPLSVWVYFAWNPPVP